MGEKVGTIDWDYAQDSTLVIFIRGENQIAHNIFAFFVKCCLDEECTKSKAQSVISVFNTSLPARGTRLQQTKNRDNRHDRPHLTNPLVLPI